MILLYLLYSVPLVVVLAPIVILTRKLWRWRLVDFAGAMLPGLTWLYLVGTVDSRGRSLSNLIELPLLAMIVAALASVKPTAERRIPAPYAKYVYCLLTCAAAIAMYLAFPGLDE